MKFPVAATLLALCFFAPPIDAQALQRGTQELALHISPDFEGAVGDMIFIDVGYGRFIRPALEIRGVLSFEGLEDVAGEDADYRARDLAVAAEYHFRRNSRLVPYVGAAIGFRKTEFAQFEESALFGGPSGGIKYFLADNVALDFGVTFRASSADVFINDFEPESADLSSVIGLRYLF